MSSTTPSPTLSISRSGASAERKTDWKMRSTSRRWGLVSGGPQDNAKMVGYSHRSLRKAEKIAHQHGETTITEDAGIHDAGLAHDRLEIHFVQDVVLDVDPRSDF